MNVPLLELCPACDYSLDGLPDRHTCPECGFEYDKDSVILRQRVGWFDRASRPFLPVFHIAGVAFCVYIVFKNPLSWDSWGFTAFLLVSILVGNRSEKQKCVIAPDRLTLIRPCREKEVLRWTHVDHARFNRLWGGAIIECHTGRRRLTLPHWMFRNHDRTHEFIADVNERVGQLREEMQAGDSILRTDN